MKKILFFKHWQMFLLVFVCGVFVAPGHIQELINSIAVATFTIWVYTIGVYGQGTIARLGLKTMNLKLFKINLVVLSVFYLTALFLTLVYGEASDPDGNLISFGIHDSVLISVGLYSLFAAFQSIIFVCKTIAKIEFKREVSFGDYFPSFLCISFFFIGIWILQPKVTRLIALAPAPIE